MQTGNWKNCISSRSIDNFFLIGRLLLEQKVSLFMLLNNKFSPLSKSCLIPIKIRGLLVLKAVQMYKSVKAESVFASCDYWEKAIN